MSVRDNPAKKRIYREHTFLHLRQQSPGETNRASAAAVDQFCTVGNTPAPGHPGSWSQDNAVNIFHWKAVHAFRMKEH